MSLSSTKQLTGVSSWVLLTKRCARESTAAADRPLYAHIERLIHLALNSGQWHCQTHASEENLWRPIIASTIKTFVTFASKTYSSIILDCVSSAQRPPRDEIIFWCVRVATFPLSSSEIREFLLCVPCLACGVLWSWVSRTYNHFAVLPLSMVAVPALFFVALWASGQSMQVRHIPTRIIQGAYEVNRRPTLYKI